MSAAARNVMLDPATFIELGAGLPYDTMQELVDLFAAETDFIMTEIASRRAAGDLESVARLARNIVSIAGNLGAVRVGALARQLEQICRKGDKAGNYRLISEMAQACRDAHDEMAALLGEESTGLHTA